MNFDGSFPSTVWNIQCFPTGHFRAGCQGLGGNRNASSPVLATAAPTGPAPGHTEGKLTPCSSQLPLAPSQLAPLPLAIGTITPPPLLHSPPGVPAPACCQGVTRPHAVDLQVLPSSASPGLWRDGSGAPGQPLPHWYCGGVVDTASLARAQPGPELTLLGHRVRPTTVPPLSSAPMTRLGCWEAELRTGQYLAAGVAGVMGPLELQAHGTVLCLIYISRLMLLP